MKDLDTQILRIIDESPSKVTFRILTKSICGSNTVRVKTLKQAVANLISQGTLCYTFQFGHSCIERSLEKPLHISPHIIIKPPRCSSDGLKNSVVINIEKGASFGGGDHPTTRMAINLIDSWLHQSYWNKCHEYLKAIDIGTGSGILAIVAAALGFGFVLGLDTDPCSIFEARENVKLNELTDRIQICSEPINLVKDKFDLVVANLRTPTLVTLCEIIDKITNRKCVLIISGMKVEESESVGVYYREKGFVVAENKEEKGWSAMCLVRG